ncbi:hypothetical protein FSP39_008285 [Pinctada imbricata]|uniref:Glucose-methanol-choline oxidoreductase C-terminal domain-containing protein n=1 Tax=Pinctada imbricata TaxID=66713 RepID=A0AA88YQE4_PINIB|nr:hypothetical protein FSP39_008285 [Pinctada imbricata]
MSLEIGNTESFKQLGIDLDDTHLHFSECTNYEKSTDDYFKCIVHHYAVKADHPTATCRMGKTDDPTSVVDSDLRVKGISNLRIADASVMRNIVTGNTNAPTIMIGEKAADLIRNVDSVKDIRQKLLKTLDL